MNCLEGDADFLAMNICCILYVYKDYVYTRYSEIRLVVWRRNFIFFISEIIIYSRCRVLGANI